jgi:hypothetical protein
MREFSFKFFNNMLALNVRAAHFIENRNPGCAFCGRGGEGGAEQETFLHLFYSCPHTTALREALIATNVNEVLEMTVPEKKTFWLCGYSVNRVSKTMLSTMVLALFINAYIWDCKLKKLRMSLASLLLDLDDNMLRSVTLSRKMRISCQQNNMTIFRRWTGWQGQDGGEEEEEDGDDE